MDSNKYGIGDTLKYPLDPFWTFKVESLEFRKPEILYRLECWSPNGYFHGYTKIVESFLCYEN